MKDYFFIFVLVIIIIGYAVIQSTNIYFLNPNKKYFQWDKISIASFLGRFLEKKYPLAEPILRILEQCLLLYLLYLVLKQNI